MIVAKYEEGASTVLLIAEHHVAKRTIAKVRRGASIATRPQDRKQPSHTPPTRMPTEYNWGMVTPERKADTQGYSPSMTKPLTVGIASYGRKPFELLDRIMRGMGHRPVTYIISRTMRPATPIEPEFVTAISEVLESIPAGMDLLLPGRASSLIHQLQGYELDLIIVFGFNWKLPSEVLSIPRLGVINIHPSTLPKYRGPSPVLWAIRNGDAHFGITVHRMNEHIDAGPIISRSQPIALPEEITQEEVWSLISSAIPVVLTDAVHRVVCRDPGESQDPAEATYAGFPPDSWYTIDWSEPCASIHNQLRVLRLLRPGEGVITEANGRRIQLRGCSLQPSATGLLVQCADGPIWLTDWQDS